MKYFTPELIVAYGADDPAVWKDAETKWEAACQQYNLVLAALKPAFPLGLRYLEDTYTLHDAVIRGMGRREGSFIIVLQLDRPPQSLLMLTYDLMEDPVVQRERLPPDYRSTDGHIDWQYDEIDKGLNQPPTWRQSILLSNGWEILLHFRDLRVEEIQALLPAPREGAALATANMPHSV